jgi:hypothetical protein
MTPKKVLIVGWVAACTLAWSGLAAAAAGTISLKGRLGPSQEVPRQTVRTPNASGAFTGTLKPTAKGYRLSWRLTFTRLSGKATSAYLHQGKPGTHGAAFVFLCAPCTTGAHGSSFFSPSEVTLARQGRLYVNIRTTKNPAGEIRGQVTVS